MPPRNPSRLTVLALALAAGTAGAAPYHPFDVRAAGMGGTGVASAAAGSAALSNPALLSAQPEGKHIEFVFGAGVSLADEDEMFDQTDALTDTFDQLNAALTAVNMPAIQSNAADAALKLDDINGDYLLLGAGGALGFGVAGRDIGVGFGAGANAYADATPKIGGTDLGALLDLADNGVIDNPLYAGKVSGGTFQTDSTAEATGVLVAEAGVGFAHAFELGGGGLLAVGITPKMVDVTTYHYEERIDSFDDAQIDDATLETVGDHADLDLGIVYRASADTPWQFGLVARNLADESYATVPTPFSPSREIAINTQWRAGVARVTENSTLALDVDLDENAGIEGNDATQFVALGAETGLAFVQLRCGYRANLSDSDVEDVITAGIGLGPLDLSAQASDGTVGAYLQLGFGW